MTLTDSDMEKFFRRTQESSKKELAALSTGTTFEEAIEKYRASTIPKKHAEKQPKIEACVTSEHREKVASCLVKSKVSLLLKNLGLEDRITRVLIALTDPPTLPTSNEPDSTMSNEPALLVCHEKAAELATTRHEEAMTRDEKAAELAATRHEEAMETLRNVSRIQMEQNELQMEQNELQKFGLFGMSLVGPATAVFGVVMLSGPATVILVVAGGGAGFWGVSGLRASRALENPK